MKANIELRETESLGGFLFCFVFFCFFLWTAMRLNELGSAFIIDSGKHWEA